MTDAAASPALLVERDGPVVTLTNDDPPRNRMSLDYMDALETEIARLGPDRSVRAVLQTMGTKDQQEGMRAFLEKRRPRFTGE